MAAEGTTNDTGGSSVITPRRDSAVLQTADRALQVLLAFRSRPEWGVSELARELGLDKSVTQRLLSTLARRGFVLADPESRRYRLGEEDEHAGHVH